MSYNFDKLTSRHNTNCWKWDIDAPDADVIPLWVADMDFEAAPKILDALRCRLDHAVFGYTKVPNSFYEAIQGWYSRRYGWSVQKDWILYTTGVVPAVSASIMALSGGEPCGVLCQTPAYNHFFSSIRNCRCHRCAEQGGKSSTHATHDHDMLILLIKTEQASNAISDTAT